MNRPREHLSMGKEDTTTVTSIHVNTLMNEDYSPLFTLATDKLPGDDNADGIKGESPQFLQSLIIFIVCIVVVLIVMNVATAIYQRTQKTTSKCGVMTAETYLANNETNGKYGTRESTKESTKDEIAGVATMLKSISLIYDVNQATSTKNSVISMIPQAALRKKKAKRKPRDSSYDSNARPPLTIGALLNSGNYSNTNNSCC